MKLAESRINEVSDPSIPRASSRLRAVIKASPREMNAVICGDCAKYRNYRKMVGKKTCPPYPTRFMFLLLNLVLAAVVTIGITPALAAPAGNEQALTVAFLYNFLKFTEWPEGTVTNKLTLCVSDKAAFGEELDAISGRSAQNKSVYVKRIELGESPNGCQLLFLPREEKLVRIREWLKNTENTPTLMVSNVDDFLDMGGMIVLIDDGNRLQFEVNLERAKPVGLKLSAQLLKIARDVRGN